MDIDRELYLKKSIVKKSFTKVFIYALNTRSEVAIFEKGAPNIIKEYFTDQNLLQYGPKKYKERCEKLISKA